MAFFGGCPRCGTVMSQDRFVNNVAVCQCGWTDATPEYKAQDRVEKRTVTIMIASAFLMMGAYAHMVSWGGYALSIPFVKVQQLTGTLSNQGYHELAETCIALNKWSCAQTAYTDLYQSKRDLTGLEGLASMQSRREQKPEAMATYSLYFQYGGNDGDAALNYGKLLEEAGRVDEAVKMYEMSITLRPDILPVHATTSIVRHMIKVGQYDEAHARILAFHESAGNAKGYLNTELEQLETYMQQNGKRKPIARR